MALRRGRVALLALISFGLTLTTNFPSGFTQTSVNTAVAELHRFINASYVERGVHIEKSTLLWLHSAVMNVWAAGQFVGLLVGPYFSDEYGRKGVGMSIGAAGIQYVAVMLGWPELLIIGRGICAFASPFCDLGVVLYIQECSPPELRGFLSCFSGFGFGAMCLLGSILGLPSLFGSSISTLTLLAIFVEIPTLAFLFMLPETPKYLMITRNDAAGAAKSLKFFQGISDAEISQILDVYRKERDLESRAKSGSSIREMLGNWQLRRAFFLGTTFFILTLAFYPLLQSSTYFFLNSGFSRSCDDDDDDDCSEFATTSSTIMLSLYTISAICSSMVVGKFRRRPLVIFFGTICHVFLALFAVAAPFASEHALVQILTLLGVFGYTITFGLSIGPLAWFLSPELVSQRHKSLLFCTTFCVTNVLIGLTNLVVIPWFQIYGGLIFLPLFVLPSIVALVYLYRNLPETFGRETHEIISDMITERKQSIQRKISRLSAKL